jgi:V8-like Glu-specific endopeptidase
MKILSIIVLTLITLLMIGCTPNEPVEPEPTKFPVTTSEELEQFVSNEYGFICDESKGWIWELKGEIPYDEGRGCYGYCGASQPTDISGTLAFSIRINPNTGWLWQRFCNSNYLDDCPENVMNYPSDEPEGLCSGCYTFNECKIILEE